VILLDTHIWFWWVRADPLLKPAHAQYIAANEANGVGVSVISVWELAMLHKRGKVTLDRPLPDWVRLALSYPNVRLLDLTPDTAVESVFLPDPFHKDPADRFLVATARILNIPIVTQDAKILAYPHVQCAP
jgi:PIN domain nuclease of toxin-antitoxin system